jgi:hypothetical protein
VHRAAEYAETAPDADAVTEELGGAVHRRACGHAFHARCVAKIHATVCECPSCRHRYGNAAAAAAAAAAVPVLLPWAAAADAAEPPLVQVPPPSPPPPPLPPKAGLWCGPFGVCGRPAPPTQRRSWFAPCAVLFALPDTPFGSDVVSGGVSAGCVNVALLSCFNGHVWPGTGALGSTMAMAGTDCAADAYVGGGCVSAGALPVVTWVSWRGVGALGSGCGVASPLGCVHASFGAGAGLGAAKARLSVWTPALSCSKTEPQEHAGEREYRVGVPLLCASVKATPSACAAAACCGAAEWRAAVRECTLSCAGRARTLVVPRCCRRGHDE